MRRLLCRSKSCKLHFPTCPLPFKKKKKKNTAVLDDNRDKALIASNASSGILPEPGFAVLLAGKPRHVSSQRPRGQGGSGGPFLCSGAALSPLPLGLPPPSFPGHQGAPGAPPHPPAALPTGRSPAFPIFPRFSPILPRRARSTPCCQVQIPIAAGGRGQGNPARCHLLSPPRTSEEGNQCPNTPGHRHLSSAGPQKRRGKAGWALPCKFQRRSSPGGLPPCTATTPQEEPTRRLPSGWGAARAGPPPHLLPPPPPRGGTGPSPRPGGRQWAR